ncbi:type II toxin-antitoxin system HicB family antitoxin [candidate division KSB1 bacterium]|nr:type II toxin-antitoxin system HicB family antitoxin [candidate division KSB1 bacterium]
MKYYTAVLKKSGKQFVALCLELGVVGSGNTRPKAMQSLRDAIVSYLDYAAEAGLPETRPIAINELHEFLFYDKRAKLMKSRNGQMQLTTLSYA